MLSLERQTKGWNVEGCGIAQIATLMAKLQEKGIDIMDLVSRASPPIILLKNQLVSV